MSNEDYNDMPGADKLRAIRKAERREQQRKREKESPVVNRSGIWTGESYLREGAGLEKLLAERSLKVEGESTRRDKRRKRKSKSK
ncbi:MAG TPA: hypothetical protein VH186_22645 [Chloroflexia bacterium]|nr:hypothetical protein [Chloroflexia bacterium]